MIQRDIDRKFIFIAKVENKLKFFINNNKELSEGDIIID